MNGSPLIFSPNTPCVCPPRSRNPAEFLHFLTKHQQAALVAAGIYSASHWCSLKLKTNSQVPWKMAMRCTTLIRNVFLLPLVTLCRCPKYQESSGHHLLGLVSNLPSHKTIHSSPFPEADTWQRPRCRP